MIVILHIGMTNRNGQFNSPDWPLILKWIDGLCNNIRIYTFDLCNIENLTLQDWTVEDKAILDSDANWGSYRLWNKDRKLSELLFELSFGINDGIDCLEFYNNDYLIAELTVEDHENFFILHVSEQQEISLTEMISDVGKNIKMCNLFKSDIDYFVENKPWKPLGLK